MATGAARPAGAVLVAVGDELVLGERPDTNSPWAARCLAGAGIQVLAQVTVGDGEEAIAAAVAGALQQARLVIVGGGLGPTDDDRTRQALARACGRPLEEHAEALASVTACLARVGRPLRAIDRVQGLVPVGGRVLANPLGTAPGLVLEVEGRQVAALPGVPVEYEHLLRQLLPELQARHGQAGAVRRRVVTVTGISEARLGQRLRGLEAVVPWGTLCRPRAIQVVLRAQGRGAEARLARGAEALEERLADLLHWDGEDPVAAVLVRELLAREETVAVAESCTGGRVAAALTDCPGASGTFQLAAVTYANRAKEELLGVPARTLAEHGAVSEAVARAMAAGVAERAGVDWSVATTGVAGPGGGSPEKPVGLVWIATCHRPRVGGEPRVETRRFQLGGSRQLVQERATGAALGLLLRRIRDQTPAPRH
jgi:nicotinamide-nucleotide amidase